MAVGYSGTPLAKKLGYEPGCKACVSGAPADYFQLLAPLPQNVTFSARAGSSTDLVHLFVTQRPDLATRLQRCRGTLKPEAIQTEVFLLPAAAVPESDGSFTNTQRLVQWHDKAVDPPGACRSRKPA